MGIIKRNVTQQYTPKKNASVDSLGQLCRHCAQPVTILRYFARLRRKLWAFSLVPNNATAWHSIFLNKKSPIGDCLLTKIGGGSGWIRTTSGLSQQIYSLPRLSNSGARPISNLPVSVCFAHSAAAQDFLNCARCAQ